MNQTRIAVLLLIMIIPLAALAQTAARSGRTRSNKADKPARHGFYFQLRLPAANASAGWEDEAIKLLRAANIPAFYGSSSSYKGITFETFVPVRSLRVAENPRRLKNVWVGAFETEEAAIAELEKFSRVLRPVLLKLKQERAELKYNDEFRDFETWNIGALKISGSEVEKPNSSGDEAAAERDWNNFWTEFRAAVEKRNRAALRALTAFSIRLDNRVVPANAAFERFDGDAGENLWRRLDEALATGAKKPDGFNRRPMRETGDDSLFFDFSSGGRWRWRGFWTD